MEKTDFETLRSRLHETITEVVGSEEASALMISGWILIYEGVQMDDERSLTVLSSDATGDRDLPPWSAEGILNYVAVNDLLYENYAPEDEDDDA